MTPSSQKQIPLFKPHYNTSKILSHLEEIFTSGWTGLGPVTETFETHVAKFVSADYCSFLNSCTSALHLALEALRLPKNAIVVVPDITFASTASIVLQAQHQLVLAPVSEDNLSIDLDWLHTFCQSNDVKCVIPVHYSGNCCNIDQLLDLANKHKFLIIEDCAHAIGSKWKGKSLGTFGDLGCYSFHSVKNLAICDGGALVGKNKYKDYLKSMRWLGINKSTFERSQKSYSFSYDIEESGYKYHGNDVMAVIGLHNLELLPEDNANRHTVYKRYKETLPINTIDPNTESSHHLVTMFIENRNEFIDHMNQHNITVGVHYKPLSSFKAFSQNATPEVKKRGLSVFEKIASLPCYPSLTKEDQDFVIQTTNSFLNR